MPVAISVLPPRLVKSMTEALHPVRKETLTVEAPLPEDMTHAIEDLSTR